MPDDNGSSPRLDRIEKIMEVLANVQRDMQTDLQVVLRAQVVMGDHLEKLTKRMDKLTERVDKLAENAVHTDERLNALIAVVDSLVRRPPATT
jgi:cob(I)alamin adenosyltransferase